MPMVRSPCTLLWPAHRAHPGARAADVAAEQQEVDDLADGGHRVAVLGQPHRPAHDDRRTPSRPPGGPRSSCSAGTPAMASSSSTSVARTCVAQLVEAVGVLVDERRGRATPSLEQATTAAGVNSARSPFTRTWQVVVGQRRARPEHAADLLRVAEAQQPGLGQRVDGDDRGAVRLGPLERGEHPRMVGARVLADDEDQVGPLEVVEGDRALADADGLARAPGRSTRGTCSSSPAGCWCRTGARTAGRGRRPRCWCGPRCRRPPGRGGRAPAARSPISANASSQRHGS